LVYFGQLNLTDKMIKH